MKILIKKFSLLRNGVAYGAGQVVDLPEQEALQLVREAPKEFVLLEAAQQAAVSAQPEAEPAGAELAAMTVEQLKAYALQSGIDLGKTTKKADIINLIEAVEAGAEDGLPAVDAGMLVK